MFTSVDFYRQTKLYLAQCLVKFALCFVFVTVFPLCECGCNIVNVFGADKNYKSTNLSEMTDVRILLSSLYDNRESISVNSTKISFGYCNNDRFYGEVVFSSSSGFSFTPVTSDKGLYISSLEFSSYADAAKYINSYFKDYSCFPCSMQSEKWSLMFIATENTDSINDSEIQGLLSVHKFKPLKSSDCYIKMNGSGITVFIDGQYQNIYPQIKALSDNGILNLGKRSYRGRIEIGRYDGSKLLSAVNIVNIDAYLLGVVTCEMGASSPIEALKAQAVAARSYCLAKTGYKATGSLKKDAMTDTASSQVYKGYNFETTAGYNAVASTLGEIIMHNNKPVQSFYFSTSGGATDSISDIWKLNSNVFTGVFDFYELDPELSPWIRDFSDAQVDKLFSDNGYNLGHIKSMYPEISTSSGRIYSLKVVGDKASTSISGSKAKSLFNLPDTKVKLFRSHDEAGIVSVLSCSEYQAQSTLTGTISEVSLPDCYVISEQGTSSPLSIKDQAIVITADNLVNIPITNPEKNTWRFAGMGNGHGVGMSQSGAKGLARNGYDYKAILHFYYKNIEIQKFSALMQ